MIDFILYLVMCSVVFVDWFCLNKDQNFCKVFDFVCEFGIGDKGIIIFICGLFGEFGMFSVICDCSKEEWIKLCNNVMIELQ